MKTILHRVFTITVTIALAGCATTSTSVGEAADPLEGYNRTVFAFNETLDRAILKPIAQAYVAVLPEPVVASIGNVLGNLNDVVVLGNDLLQLKLHQAAMDSGRIVANTTFGVAGIFDVATSMGLPKHDEDFGRTLGTWGIGEGNYLILPVLGSSTTRDVFGRVGDYFAHPATWATDEKAIQWGLRGVDAVHQRASVLRMERAFGDAQIDPYVFQRDAYLQKRRAANSDAVPPPP